MFEQLRKEGIVEVDLDVVSLDGTIVRVHPDETEAFEENGPQSIGRSRGGLTTKIHTVAADERTPVIFSLSGGQAHDAPIGRKLLERLGLQSGSPSVVMYRAYVGDATRQLASGLGYSVVVPPRKSRKVA